MFIDGNNYLPMCPVCSFATLSNKLWFLFQGWMEKKVGRTIRHPLIFPPNWASWFQILKNYLKPLLLWKCPLPYPYVSARAVSVYFTDGLHLIARRFPDNFIIGGFFSADDVPPFYWNKNNSCSSTLKSLRGSWLCFVNDGT